MFTHFRHGIVKMELIPSKGGVFEVSVNGEKIYSKDETGLFPKSGQIIEMIQEEPSA
ncbi:SelT/SelW/SelH family protein [Cytobacillus depressus]|uniref:SelT/SelW/SelH family protein n=1 Tax=Cytobacillus depressus TaxID=1602942 RepID=A0A6L3V1R1_9BACI|nr:SelT/SelW/SelH family protein [Cytobacillus depressus]